jgi:hypothetical protein
MADRWRSMLVAGVAAALLALPAVAAAKPHPKRACQTAAKVKAKKTRCRAPKPEHSRGVESGHAAPAAIRDDDGRPATRAGRVLEI